MLHKDLHVFMAIPRPILCRMRNISEISCRKNQNTNFMLNFFFSPVNRAGNEITWVCAVQPDRLQMTV